jgi:predicted Fe-Mo cluster-binding NifX family protein
MKAAFAVWNDRIAPVFDVARRLRFVMVEDGRIVDEAQVEMTAEAPEQKALLLIKLGVEELVCGSISRHMRQMIAAYGIQVIPFVSGQFAEVVQAWIIGRLETDAFSMPGCRHRGGACLHGASAFGKEGNIMVGRKGSGGGGRGRGGQGRGQGGGFAAGPGGACVCPQCGHEEPHDVGTPCMEKRCPKCGAIMTRR